MVSSALCHRQSERSSLPLVALGAWAAKTNLQPRRPPPNACAGPRGQCPEGSSMVPKVTRGSGLLEPFLAQQRARMANRLIPDNKREARVLGGGGGSSSCF